MDISKLKFDIQVRYDCAEDAVCSKFLEDGTYEKAKRIFEELDSKT